MRIAFLDPIQWDYNVESAYKIPLGGSQSALCYLAQALAQWGHEVFLVNNTSQAGIFAGVMHFPLKTVPHQLLRSLDALILWNTPGIGQEIKALLSDRTCFVLWSGIAYYQPAMRVLQNPAEQDIYDGIVFVSEWQRQDFFHNFRLNPTRTCIIRNAVGTPFCELFSTDGSILSQKSQPPIIAYTSAPDRGLNLLLDVFPAIRTAVPGTKLKVFSSMKLYQVSDAEDRSEHGQLYQLCQDTEGVEYIGSLPQTELARELRTITVLAYANVVPETSCIAVMEAMASGCWVVTSNWGGLPETTAGFARLIPVADDWDSYKASFLEETIQILKACTATDAATAETHLMQQVEYVNRDYNWSVRAQQWVHWLSCIGANTATVELSDSSDSALIQSADLHLLAYQCLIQDEYTQAKAFYEQAIEVCPTFAPNYWYLGLTHLIQSQDEEAQATWMLTMMEGEPEQIDLWIAELVQVLQAEVARRRAIGDLQTAQHIEQYITEMTHENFTHQ